MISFGLCSLREPRNLVHIDAVVVAAHAVGHRLEPFARHVDRRAVGEMPAGGEIEPHEGVAGLQQREEHFGIGRAPECGCTLANLQPNNLVTRSIASRSAMSTNWQPP